MLFDFYLLWAICCFYFLIGVFVACVLAVYCAFGGLLWFCWWCTICLVWFRIAVCVFGSCSLVCVAGVQWV